MPNVTIYSTPACVYCKMAKKFFDQHKVAYEERDVVTDMQAREEMIAKSGQLGVPVIVVGDAVVVGFDKGKLIELLKLR
ncbi:MAG: glutaredoxin family protein [Candidatus Jorgensenbacteria bacterium]